MISSQSVSKYKVLISIYILPYDVLIVRCQVIILFSCENLLSGSYVTPHPHPPSNFPQLKNGGVGVVV